MEKPHRIAMIYGYAVCLVAIITLLIAIPNMVNSIIDLGDPIHSGGFYSPAKQPSLASFENYKMDVLSTPQSEGKTGVTAYVPDDQTLRAMYEAARDDKIASALHIARRTIVVFGLLTIISALLFIIHFRWMRTLSKAAL
ncbi:hypothetical protein TRIP_C90139 [Candidatus Zixiibacteriota bacterium]|nr:hypothetical protein TRIP_C90139 [candidate division Zixibacteria bacterium]